MDIQRLAFYFAVHSQAYSGTLFNITTGKNKREKKTGAITCRHSFFSFFLEKVFLVNKLIM